MDFSNKKILFITGYLSSGGAEKVMSILASQCAEMGANVSLAILREGKEAYPVSSRVHIYRAFDAGVQNRGIERIRRLHNIIKTAEPEVLIPFLPIITLYTAIANIGLHKKIIMSERADPFRSVFSKDLDIKDRIGNFIMRRLGLLRLAEHVVFQTEEAMSFYSKSIQKKSSLIPNPLDLSSLPKRFNGAREPVIIAAGRFAEEKNFPMLIRAFARFHEEFPAYKLVIYGEGDQRNTYEKLIRKLGVETCVSMPGFIKDLPKQMFNKAMYVSSSNHEGISNSMLEALGMGVPTIVTDCPVGGARMFVRTDENGILIPMDDEDALLKAMCRIASDPEYADRISRKAVEIREKLSAEQICEQWLELV